MYRQNTVLWGLRWQGTRMAVAVGVGAATGLLVFALTQVTGRNLFIVTGSLAGAVTATILQFYARTARLSEVTIQIPQVSELTFVVNNDARNMAWHLFVETATRISTQPLSPDEGHLREALNSLYGLFATTRDTLKAGRPSKGATGGRTVEYLAITMLNRELRPFLATWHPRLHTYERLHPQDPESAWSDGAECRAALGAVQHNLHTYTLGFARLAGVHAPELLLDETRRQP
ncbi:hypothetical protein OG785_35640 [Streptomyces sp. NBC_00006]|uniref:hypothetical protein n=1 Tax=unclassified Streptomyces TaxID=2593676 RepID=UPI002250D138|nr:MULTISPECIES: hypothetical protein [unclassified Streptomyces]MCX5535875.1 hypothetical protein [Streptomyces sp. NBC_00006]